MAVRFLEDLNVDGNVGIGTTSPSTRLHVSNVSSNDQLTLERTGTFTGEYTLHTASNNFYIGNTVAGSFPLAILNNGNIGVGTTSPAVKLDVVGDAQLQSAAPRLVMKETGTSKDFSLKVQTDGRFSFINDNLASEVLTIEQGGDVGIGTTSPSQRLEIVGAYDSTPVKLLRHATYGNIIQLGRNGVSETAHIGYPADSTLNFSTASLERMRIDLSGNVGIGTSSPNAKLSVKSSGTNNWVFRATASDGGDLGGIYEDGGTNAELYIKNSAGTSSVLINSSGDSYFNGGDVGIGTSAPAKKLDVNGDTNITGYLDLKTSSPTGSPLLRFYQSTTRRGFIQMADTNNNLRVASEYGSVSLEAASTSGVDSDTSYIRIKPGGTVEIGAVDGDATISTDGSMTFKIDADNDETSQKFSFVNNAGTEVASIDESGNLTLTGGINLSLPTSPGTTGTLWNDRGTVRVS